MVLAHSQKKKKSDWPMELTKKAYLRMRMNQHKKKKSEGGNLLKKLENNSFWAKMVLIRGLRSLLAPFHMNSKASGSLILVRGFRAKQLVFDQFGEPPDVVRMIEKELPKLQSGEVRVSMLAAPVNPADYNTIQGKYPVKVNLPCIAGNEGVGTVLEIGPGVVGISPGNKVIMDKPLQGTWVTENIFNSHLLRVVPDDIGIVEAATMSVNPCTAYRMLNDFKPVRQGQVVIQNGANSACGQAVIQLCKAWNITNVNIVRNRTNIEKLKTYLKELGASYVLTEEEFRATKMFKDGVVERPTLALNCVGGKSALEILRSLKHSGAMVTYGGMSREPVTVPTSAFIFKNISCHGYWMTEWNEKSSTDAKDKMMDEIINLIREKKLRASAHTMVPFHDFKFALQNALNIDGFTGSKFILDCKAQ